MAEHHVFAYAALPDVDAEFEQFAVDAGCTPTGILPAPPADQSADLARNDRPSRLAAAHLLGPEQAKPARCQATTVTPKSCQVALMSRTLSRLHRVLE